MSENKDENKNKDIEDEKSLKDSKSDNNSILEKENQKEKKEEMKEEKEMEESNEIEFIYQKENKDKNEYNFWSMDLYLHYKYMHVNIILRYICEALIFGVGMLAIPIVGLIITGKNIDWKQDNIFGKALKHNLFVYLSYFADLVVFLFFELFLEIGGFFLNIFYLYESTICTEIVNNIYIKRIYIRTSVSCFLIFNLSNQIYGEYARPTISISDWRNIAKTLLLWFGIYTGALFLTKFIVRVCTFKIRRSGYRKNIICINFKSFVFKKLKIIAEYHNDSQKQNQIIKEYITEYDNGLTLKYNDPMFWSTEEARISANNTYALLGIKEIDPDTLKNYFLEDYENAYNYLVGADVQNQEKKKTDIIKYTKLAEELVNARRDMKKTLRDQDNVFDKLDLIFSFLVSYGGLVLLLYLFGANFKVFVTSIGTSLITVSWIFADTIKTIFNCFVFLLAIRPYNCGDKVVIEEKIYYVYKIDLLNTTFITPFKEIVYISNTKLLNSDIRNVARSPGQVETLKIIVDSGTTYEKAITCEEKAKSILMDEIYFNDCRFRKILDNELYYEIEHKQNFQSDVDMRMKRNLIIKIFKKALSSSEITHKESFEFSHASK